MKLYFNSDVDLFLDRFHASFMLLLSAFDYEIR